MTVTIKDVARLAGVSSSTVSRTCSNHPSISKQTKEKVHEAMSALGYEPNFNASNLANKNSRTIGVILPVSETEVYQNSFYLETIRGIGQFCNQKQYMNTIITGGSEKELLQVIKSTSKSSQVEGFIVLYSKNQDPILEYLYEKGLLHVLIGKTYNNTNQTIYVDNDNILASKEAANYLIKLGHKKIAYLGSDTSHIFAQDRKTGYIIALTENKIDYNENYYIEEPFIPDIQNSKIRNLLTCQNPPTAIVVSDDILAVALEKISIYLKIKIPEQLSIISFNNSLFAKLTYPQLTSVDINSHQLGVEAASQIINHIENPNLLATKIIVPHKIIERNSCISII